MEGCGAQKQVEFESLEFLSHGVMATIFIMIKVGLHWLLISVKCNLALI